MTAFAYKALNANGSLEQGRIEAGDADDAARLLDRRGLIPVSVEEPRSREKAVSASGVRVPAAQVTRLLSDLSIMLNAGIRIDEALSIMGKEFDNGRLKPVVAGLHASLSSGRSFSQALEDWPQLFPPFQIAMVKVAESTGMLPSLLERTAEERQRFETLAARVSEALRYPAVLMLGTIAVLVFFMIGVLPQFEPMLAQTRQPDAFLDTMLGISAFLREQGQWIMAAVAVVLVMLLVAARRGTLRTALWSVGERLPILSDIAHSYRTTRFTRLLGMMSETGVAAPVAIKLISDAVDHGEPARERAQRASDAVRQGQRLSHAMEILDLPPLAMRMLRIGEQSGEMANLAYKVADFYEARLERSLSRTVGFVGPAAVATISVLIGGMIVSIMSTLMSFNDLVR